VDPGPISFTLLLLFTFTRTIYFLAYYYCFPLDTLNPLFTANRWDWQPHRKLGAKFLVVLCAGSMLMLLQSKALDEAPYKLSGAVAKLAGITFWSLAFSYWFDKPRFLTEGKLAIMLIIPSSWGSQLGGYLPASVIPSTANSIYFLQVLFYFIKNKHLFPHYTLILCFQQNQWDWQPHCKLGQSILVVLWGGSTLLTNTGSAPYQKSASSNLQ
jgi:hypothetical protein